MHHRCLPPEVPARAVAGLDSHWTILAKAEESETEGNQVDEDQNNGKGAEMGRRIVRESNGLTLG